MDSFDNKIRNAFEHQNDVPDDYSWENMEAGIMEKMNRQIPKQPKSLRKWKILRTIIGFSTGIAVLIFFYLFLSDNRKQTSDTQLSIEKSKQTNKNNIAHDEKSTLSDYQPNQTNTNRDPAETTYKNKSISETTKNQMNSTVSENDNTLTANTASTEPKKDFSFKNTTSNSKKDDTKLKKDSSASRKTTKNLVSNNTKSSNHNPPLGKTEISISSETNNIQHNTNKYNHSNLVQTNSPNNQSKSANTSPFKNTTKAQNIIIKKIPYLPINPIESSLQGVDITDFCIKEEVLIDKKADKKFDMHFALEINSGGNFWQGKYDKAPVMNAYTNKQIGFFNSANIILVTPKWDFNLGYEHRYLQELLNYKKVTQVPVTFENILLNTNTTAYSGNQQTTYGDTTVMRDRTVKIVNYNTFISHVAAIGVTRKFNPFEKLTWGFHVGLQYAFNTKTEGIYLDEQIMYHKHNDKIAEAFEVKAGLSLQYAIRPKWSLISGFSFNQTLGQWSIESTQISKPSVVSLGIGIRYFL